MMNVNKKYQILISSTYTDLIDARAKVIKTILSMYQFPVGMEMFSAGDNDQWTIIKRTIDISDYYVLILGHRYGSVTDEGISYTEKEYDYTRKKGIPILAFIMNRDASTRPSERENDPVLQGKLETFVKKAKGSKMCDFWNTEEELASKVSVALMKEFMINPQIGWVRADQMVLEHCLIEEDKQLDSERFELEYNVNTFLNDKERWGWDKSTLDGYQGELKFFLEYFKEKTITTIDTEHIKSFLRYREDNFSINSKSTMERIRSILKVFFDWLVEERVIDSNPVKKIRAFKIQKVVRDVLNKEEVEQVRNVCKTPRERALVELLLSTGCKLGELEKISLNNINWKGNAIEITCGGDRDRVVLLTGDAAEHLQKYLETRKDNTDFLFVTERRPYRSLGRRSIQDEISNIADRTNIKKKINPTTFRHTFAKTMLNNGHPMYVVQTLLGNKEYTSTSETYFKITSENFNKMLRIKGKVDK